jgi:8-oxo-dGTP pyrophosphatase MutT (NUDIX family)
MVRRHHAVAFMAGAHVFPGGRVDDSDYSADTTWCDGVAEARTKLPDVAPDAALAFHVAAARELFEEAGVLVAHWVTPPLDIRRFDTRFFVSRVPPQQAPVHDDHEATDSVWIKPADAIAAAGRGEILLPPPTRASLRELERFTSVDAALRWAQTRAVYRREPRVTTEVDGTRRMVLPGDPSLPEPEPVAFETRFVLADGRWNPEPVA